MFDSAERVPLAVAGGAPLGFVDEFGYVHRDDGTRIEWWVLGDDYWHVPRASASRRQRAVDNTPVIETTIRVPGGDVGWRVAAAVSADGPMIAVECHNLGSIPVAVAIARVNASEKDAALAVASLAVDPVTHGTTWRAALGADGTLHPGGSAPPDLPPTDAIARGWLALARQGAQIALGAPTLDDALVASCTSLLLHQGGLVANAQASKRHRLSESAPITATAAAVATALTFLGHEDQAEALRLAAKLKPRRRGLPIVSAAIPEVHADPLLLMRDPALAAATVAAIRAITVDDTEPHTIDLLPGADTSWLGRSVDISNLPSNHGSVSFALRWHGDHPALLWEAPRHVTLRASALDPAWTTTDQEGEALLGARARATGS